MKRIIIINVLLSSLCQYATTLETLQKVKTDLIKGEKSVSDAVTKLSSAYEETQKKVTTKISAIVKNDLSKPLTMLKTDISSLVPGGIPGMPTMGAREAIVWYLASAPAQITILSGLGVGLGFVTFGAGAALVTPVIVAISASIPLLVDVPAILDRIIAVLESIQTTLLSVKENIEPVNEQLNPATDPQKIYEHLHNAQTKFKDAQKIVEKIIITLKKIAEEI